MGMAAILVMWLVPFEQTLFPPSQGSSTWNLASIGPVISEEKVFEMLTYDGRRKLAYTISSPVSLKAQVS